LAGTVQAFEKLIDQWLSVRTYLNGTMLRPVHCGLAVDRRLKKSLIKVEVTELPVMLADLRAKGFECSNLRSSCKQVTVLVSTLAKTS
jgi:hypothetical protein